MNHERISNVPCWYVIHTHPKQEDRAEDNLKAWSVEIFNPKLREQRYNQYTGSPTYVTKSLFPRYLFARFNASDLLHKVHFTRGIHSVVSFGNCPTLVDDKIIDIIQLRVGEDGFVKIGDKLKYGDKVIIKDGPLKSFVGIFEREVKEAERIMMLLTTVSYAGRVIVERDLVRKIS